MARNKLARVISSGHYDKTEDCGCEVRWATDALVDGITYCPMHKAAPAMLAALEEAAAAFHSLGSPASRSTEANKRGRLHAREHETRVRAAIAQARGQS